MATKEDNVHVPTRVEDLLNQVSQKNQFKSINVEKPIDLEFDEGNLLACDSNQIDLQRFRQNREEFLLHLTRDNTQLLFNKIWELPIERIDNVVLAKLPDPKTVLPREKQIPKERPLTKWQQYAQLKGIHNRKKSRFVFDEAQKEWRPRWGYKRANDETKSWLMEVPEGADPNEDQFAKKAKEKRERAAKNELQRLRNIARTTKAKVPGVGLTPTTAPTKDNITKALALARKSTASFGKFTENLPKEKPNKFTGKKRKFESNYSSLEAEKKTQLELLKRISGGQPVLNVQKATNDFMHSEDQDRSKQSHSEGKKRAGKGRKSGHGAGAGRGRKSGHGAGVGKGKKSGHGAGAGRGRKLGCGAGAGRGRNSGEGKKGGKWG